MKQILLAGVIICFLLPSCNQSNKNTTIDSTAPDSVQVKVTYLGTAGWEITDGKTVILIDPYLSRIRRNYSEDSIDSTFEGDSRIYPAIVLPSHWDDFTLPFTSSQQEKLKELDFFRIKIAKVSPKTKVMIPKYFEPIIIPVKEQ